MDQGYESFCMVDPLFYDAMRSEETAGESFATASRALPSDWRHSEQDDWLSYHPAGVELPGQGWKIHVSACLENANRILDTVWDFCLDHRIAFKFLRSPAALVARVSKYAPRGYSGKLVTIYPPDSPHCEQVLADLGAKLDGEPSPYILTDLRIGAGPLYVRYGAFAMRYCVGDDGQIVPALADPEGRLVPDKRDPVFQPPPWVTIPDFLHPHLEARNAVRVDDLPYTVERVVHFSNGGGIYVGRDHRTGEEVVLKEARPHSGLDAWGHDAVRRLEREYEILRKLEGIPSVPRAYDLFWVGEHRFLAMEFVDAEPLSRALVQRYPLIDPSASREEFKEFSEWALDIHRQVQATIDAVHDRGIVYGDLHLFNIMVRPDRSIALLDYEVAAPEESAEPPGLGNQGFSPPQGTRGYAVDEYALACLRLALFLPMTNLLWLDRSKAWEFAHIIDDHFFVPPGFLDEAIEVIAPNEQVYRTHRQATIEPDPAQWPQLRDSLVRSIVASATPERKDRLFPGDIEQFAVGGLGLAYGASGVLYALEATGAGRFPQFEEWLLERVRTPPVSARPGLYDGLSGVAFALDHLGHRQPALDVLDGAVGSHWHELGIDFAGGLAGIGLNLLHFARHEPAAGGLGLRMADVVSERIDDRPPAEISGGEHPSAGLLRGSAGPALFLIRAYDLTGDSGYLDRAAVALRQDLRCCVVRDNGALEVDEGWRTMPYLDVGSAGIGIVLDEYLARRGDQEFNDASRGARRAAESPLYILPGLFSGRAGMLYCLGRRLGLEDPRITKQVKGLAWHALRYGGGIAFPGTALLRLSMDLATGTAGILLALGSILHDRPVHAPFLAPAHNAPPLF